MHEEMPKPNYESLIAVESIPPMPETAAKLLLMATDPDVEVGDLSAVIERDPALNARLLGIANSAFYAPQPPVMNVREAVIRVLGLGMVRNMAVGMSLTGGLATEACPHFDLTSYWISALGTADLASGLSRASNSAAMPSPDTAYLVGLLHNLGELLMVHLWPKKMDVAIRMSLEIAGGTLEEHERDLFGLDHWEAGAFLARHWQLPPVVGDAIEAMGKADCPTDDEPLVVLLRATRRWMLAVMAGHGDVLRVRGVDETYCEYRSNNFAERYDNLRVLASSMN